MARIRTIKPEFFDDPKMADVSPLARLAFIGLWTQVDKAGRILYEPKRLKVRILPFDECDVDAVMTELVRIGVVTVYKADDRKVLQVNAFLRHQRPHPREPESDLPERATAKPDPAVKENGQPCKGDVEPVRKGREGNGKEGEGNGEACPPIPDATLDQPNFDQMLRDLIAAYPASGRSTGRLTMDAFLAVFLEREAARPVPVVYAELLEAIENHKASAQWAVKRMVPKLEKWLREGLYLQRHDPTSNTPGKPDPWAFAKRLDSEAAS